MSLWESLTDTPIIALISSTRLRCDSSRAALYRNPAERASPGAILMNQLRREVWLADETKRASDRYFGLAQQSRLLLRDRSIPIRADAPNPPHCRRQRTQDHPRRNSRRYRGCAGQ